MKRTLIVNADDCNLTPGVTRAILECHDRGILSSTTFMINLPVDRQTVKALRARPRLGMGIHLNVTLGEPVSEPSKVKSLIGPDGKFVKNVGAGLVPARGRPQGSPLRHEIIREYQNQIDLFEGVMGRLPTHLDTHHQVHDDPFFFDVLTRVAQKNRLPIRRSLLMRERVTTVRTTDFIFGNLTVEGYWRKEPLEMILKNLPQGVSEIMCHPGYVDADLRRVSSFTTGREAERQLFSQSRLRHLLAQHSVQLAHFGLCYT